MLDRNYELARLAVDKAKTCVVNGSIQNPPPRVAIVLARGAEVLGWAAKGVGGEYRVGADMVSFESHGVEHAEEALLAKVQGDLSDVVAYVTLEPCTRRRKGQACADIIVQRGIRTVFIGNCDPNPDIAALAWRVFLKNRVAVRDFVAELRNEARRDNAAFFDKFVLSRREVGSASFDYTANGGVRELGPEGRTFHTRWTNRGRNSIYALDYKFHVSVAKNCAAFDEIDDPGRWFEDNDYTKPVDVGQIVVFRNDFGFALVRITGVVPPSPEGNAELSFEYVLRYRNLPGGPP